MQRLRNGIRVLLGASLLLTAAVQAAPAEPYWQTNDSKDRETYVKIPLPPGIKVVDTELEGPVFATADGKTLYTWPLQGLRNGNLGDRRKSGVSTCDDTVYQETSGYMSPYPPGFLLPDLDKRRSCDQLWPAVLATDDAKPVGKWTTVKRKDGKNQWAFDGLPVYTSDLDRQAGDVFGGTNSIAGGSAGALRYPIGPQADLPPELDMIPFRTGHMLTNNKGFSVYTSDADAPGKSNCSGACLQQWSPVLTPQTAKARGEWTIVERSPGLFQWAFRGMPIYTFIGEKRTRSMTGSDVPGWNNVFTQRALPPPQEFRVKDSRIGQVLADAQGKTIYVYACNDDAMDQQTCDHPDAPQVYRMAICGNFDPKVCQATFPYVKAAAGAVSESSLWTVMTIDSNTGLRAEASQPGSMTVWAYRGRPVYTYGKESGVGSADGENYGEFNGQRNGFRAFWVRDDYRNNVTGRTGKDRGG